MTASPAARSRKPGPPRRVDLEPGSAAALARFAQVLRAILAARPWRPRAADEDEMGVAGQVCRIDRCADLAGANVLRHCHCRDSARLTPSRDKDISGSGGSD